MKRAELLTIGSELLNGSTVNTNAAYLARALGRVGLSCQRQVAVADAVAAVADALREALTRADVLVTTGGLGPTLDDITVAAMARVTHRPLRYHPSSAKAIRRFYTKRHRHLQQAALRQAYLPSGAVPLVNPLGTAPGVWLPLGDQLLIALPGVPAEMRAIMEQAVLPRLKSCATAGQATVRCTLRTAGIVELSIEAMLRQVRIPSDVEIGLYPNLRLVDVCLTATAPSARAAHRVLRPIEYHLRRSLGTALYGTGEDTLEAVIGALLRRQRRTIGLAESCTGGLVTDQLTNVPGSSQYVRGAIVAYANEVKQRELGVPRTLLTTHGAVSAPVACAMAQGARAALGATIGLSLTGIAGPSGASARKPVGLIFIAIADTRRTRVHRLHCVGDRAAIKMQAAQAALNLLRLHLK